MSKIHEVLSHTGEYEDRRTTTVMTYTNLASAKAHAKRANRDALAAGVHWDQPKADYDERDEYTSPADPSPYVDYTGIRYTVWSTDLADNLADGLAKLVAR